MAIFYGLLAAFAWAGADFLARHVARIIGPVRTFILAQCVGLVALTLFLAAVKDPHWHMAILVESRTRAACLFGLAAAALNIAGSMALYRSFAIGKMALVTPIAASYPALTVVLALASGERLKTSAAVGIPIVLAGLMLAVIPIAGAYTPPASPQSPMSPRHERHDERAGVGWALAASISFGVAFWTLGFHVTGTLGGVVPIWIIRLTGASLVVGLAAGRRSKPLLQPASVFWPVVASAVLDTTAFVATTLGLATGHVSVVTVLSSLFGVVIVLMSWVLLKERLHWRQWFGVAMIFAGVALVSR